MKNLMMGLLIPFILFLSLSSCQRDITNTGIGKTALNVEIANYYIAPNGNDNNPGTIDEPFKSWDKILNLVNPGDLVYIRGGVYYPDALKTQGVYLFGKNGKPDKPIRLWAYPGEVPILDCSSMRTENSLMGFEFSCNYWHIKGLEIKNVPQYIKDDGTGFFCVGFYAHDCNNNIFETLNVHHNSSIGCLFTGNSDNNMILNSDFHHNYDPNTYNSGVAYPGGNADGLHMTIEVKNMTNTIKGCRFWKNSDDGLDLWYTEGNVIVDNCWFFWNGYKPTSSEPAGDGNGLKLGPTKLTLDADTHRIVKNCIAFSNRARGFVQNNANVLMVFENNIAYKNGDLGYVLANFPLQHRLYHNIAYNNNGVCNIAKEAIQIENSWNIITALTDSAFVSVNFVGIDGQRMPDGSLPAIDFLKFNLKNAFWTEFNK